MMPESHRFAGPVLVVDDEPHNVEILRHLVTRLGYRVVTASNGALALAAVERERPDLVLLDVQMPELDGLETCRRLKGHPETRLIPVVLITALSASEDRVQGIEAGADDFISKPFIVAELDARVRSLMRLKRYTDELDSAERMILTLALTIEARDPYTGGHCERLARYATALGERLGLDEDELVALHRGGFLHDVGKVGIPDAILLKRGVLSPSEMMAMQQHTAIGEKLCSELHSLAAVRPIIRHHHERLDGGGYPDRLAGDQIPLLAQIINVVDCFDAMATERSYKAALPPEAALDELREDVRRGWKRQDLVGAFTALIGESGPKLLAPAPFLLASQRFPRCDAVPQREAVDVRAGAVSDSSSLSSSPRPSDA